MMVDELDVHNAKPGVQPLLASFRHIGLPLMQALAEAGHGQAGHVSDALQPDVFARLVDSTIVLSKAFADVTPAEAPDPAALRWSYVGAAAQVVAACFRASGKALTAEEAGQIAALSAGVQEKFKAQFSSAPETSTDKPDSFRSRIMESLVPVIGAVAQYSFGRAEHNLLAEVAERLVKTSDQMTRALAPAGATSEQWRLLCWNILRAAGQIYTECHYAEADRLLYMSPDERAAYFTQHGNVVPMTQVWQAFNQRMAMLATLATYLEVPSLAEMGPNSLR